MKKKVAISVKDLKVSSFVTNADEAKEIKGGTGVSLPTYCGQAGCGWCLQEETCECETVNQFTCVCETIADC